MSLYTQVKQSYKHISEGVDKTIHALEERKSGKIKPLKTSLAKLDEALLNGVDWNRIFTIAGMSGSGKSTLLEQLKNDFITLNDPEDFAILSFEFEMLIEDQLVRRLSAKLEKSVKEIYSAPDIEAARAHLSTLKASNIFYVDNAASVTEIKEIIITFVKDKIIPYNKALVVTLDHTLLTKDRKGEGEKKVIDDLMQELVALKIYLASINVRSIFIVLSQLNRDIESQDRVSNPLLHYPNRNDIFAASSVFYCSDYVLVTHRPSIINGISAHYGPPSSKYPKGLPIYNPKDPSKSMVYFHLLKERFGESKILMMTEDFKNSRLLEYTS